MGEDWKNGLDLFVESLIKPDHELRNTAKARGCYDELMQIREMVIRFTEDLRSE